VHRESNLIIVQQDANVFSFFFFYIRGSVHRNSRLKKPNEKQQHADIYLLLNYSTCFGRPSRPSSGVHKTVVAASGTDRTVWAASFFKHDQIRTYLVTFEVAGTINPSQHLTNIFCIMNTNTAR